ncbi:MAG TPA: hypothetical protein PLA03_13590 [Acidobacteriota bacterium]|jgi:hypothetical protein|nr:hypothetical protein [Acidobacteriota bacterium]
MKTLWEQVKAISSRQPITGEAACRETLLKRLWSIKIARSQRENLIRIFLVTEAFDLTILDIQNGDVRAEYFRIGKRCMAIREFLSRETEELIWVMDTSAEKDAERLSKLFHEMWTAACDSPAYDKLKWRDFVELMGSIGIQL